MDYGSDNRDVAGFYASDYYVMSVKVGGILAEHTFLFFGAEEAGMGIEELIALEMSMQTQLHPGLPRVHGHAWPTRCIVTSFCQSKS